MSDYSKTRGSNTRNLYECESELRRGPWTLEEDNLLIHYISCHGEGRWNSLAKFAGLKRTGKSCRLRWLNYLKPDIKRGDLTPHEQLVILELHSKWGNKWSKIAQHLPGRTDNEIKNYWRTRVQKQARQLKVDSNSKKFIEAIRTFWMPRLVEQMEQNHSPSASISTVETLNPSSLSPKAKSNSDSNFAAQVSGVSADLTTGKIPTAETYYDEGMGFPSCCYDMQELDGHDVSLPGRHVAGIDWFGEDFMGMSTFSNTDELWQFRNLEEFGMWIED